MFKLLQELHGKSTCPKHATGAADKKCENVDAVLSQHLQYHPHGLQSSFLAQCLPCQALTSALTPPAPSRAQLGWQSRSHCSRRKSSSGVWAALLISCPQLLLWPLFLPEHGRRAGSLWMCSEWKSGVSGKEHRKGGGFLQ